MDSSSKDEVITIPFAPKANEALSASSVSFVFPEYVIATTKVVFVINCGGTELLQTWTGTFESLSNTRAKSPAMPEPPMPKITIEDISVTRGNDKLRLLVNAYAFATCDGKSTTFSRMSVRSPRGIVVNIN